MTPRSLSLSRLVSVVRPLIPTAFNTCLYLTLIAFVLAGWNIATFVPPTGQAGEHLVAGAELEMAEIIKRVVNGWYLGFMGEKELGFALQMCLIMVTGGALARTPLFRGPTRRLARWACVSTSRASLTVAIMAMSLALLSWGLSLVFAAILAREIGIASAERKPTSGASFDYRVVAAAAYMGLIVWHCGLTGSAPLLANDQIPSQLEGELKKMKAGLVELDSPYADGVQAVGDKYVVPIQGTLFSWTNASAVMLVSLILVLGLYSLSKDPQNYIPNPYSAEEAPDPPVHPDGARGDHWLARAVGVLLVVAAVIVCCTHIGPCQDLNVGLEKPKAAGPTSWVDSLREFKLGLVTFVFLFVGLLIYLKPGRFDLAIKESARDLGPIVLQFPFYFGILGVMQHCGLVERFSSWLLAMTDGLGILSEESRLYVATYLSACGLNVFVPSGGGQWMIQSPIVFRAATELVSQGVAVDPRKLVLAISFGDQATNLIQPFWVLPILPLCRMRERDILGITVFLLPFVVVAFLVVLLFIPIR